MLVLYLKMLSKKGGIKMPACPLSDLISNIDTYALSRYHASYKFYHGRIYPRYPTLTEIFSFKNAKVNRQRVYNSIYRNKYIQKGNAAKSIYIHQGLSLPFTVIQKDLKTCRQYQTLWSYWKQHFGSYEGIPSFNPKYSKLADYAHNYAYMQTNTTRLSELKNTESEEYE